MGYKGRKTLQLLVINSLQLLIGAKIWISAIWWRSYDSYCK